MVYVCVVCVCLRKHVYVSSLPREERLHRCGATEATHADAADATAAQAAGALCLCASVLVVQGKGLRPGIVVRRRVSISW